MPTCARAFLGLGFVSACAAAACSGPGVPEPKPPAFAPKDQVKCSVTKSQARPLIVEWPSADRLSLETQAKRGLVVVRYIGCEMEVLRRCEAPGSYAYTPATKHHERVTMRNDDELYASIPVFAAKFEGKLQSAGELNVDMTMVGSYEADRSRFSAGDLRGECADATHVVSSFIAGAFEFFAGAASAAGAGVEVAGAGAGAKRSAARELLNQAGEQGACAAAKPDDKTPPFGCGAFLRIEVVPLAAPPAPAAAEPALAGAQGTQGKPVPAAAPPPQQPSGQVDRDGDGILDAVDKCPADPEDRDGFEDHDGCPDPDNDADRILDVADKCPNEAETYNGKDDADGCPDGAPLVVDTTRKIEIKERVHFRVGSSQILPESYAILDAVAATMVQNPSIRVEVQGHTDSRGADSANVQLSGARADAVVKYLASKGVAAQRLGARGFGETVPIADNSTAEGRAHNNRVEFVIVK